MERRLASLADRHVSADMTSSVKMLGRGLLWRESCWGTGASYTVMPGCTTPPPRGRTSGKPLKRLTFILKSVRNRDWKSIKMREHGWLVTVQQLSSLWVVAGGQKPWGHHGNCWSPGVTMETASLASALPEIWLVVWQWAPVDSGA